jgi:spore maturation protein A
MGIVFTIVLISSILILLFTNPEGVMTSLIAGATESVRFSVIMFCIYAIWLSVLNIWHELKFDTFLGSKLKFILYKLFPNENDTCYNYLSINLSANMLGMGSAATPAGINAVENMEFKKNQIMLVVINSTSVQIIPTTILAMRSAQNATTDIILPSLIATFFSTFIGILLVKFLVK